MLTLLGQKHRFCDGVSRRNFLKIGGLALGGLSMPDLLRAEAQSAVGKSHKAIIMIFLPGGPPHQDMFEIKTEAPAEIRGEFNPIETNVPGIQICEHFPRLAGMMDKLAIIRSLVGARNEHSSHICLSGFTRRQSTQEKRPCLGSVVSHLQGPVDRAVPPFVGLAPKMGHEPWANPGEYGFLGPAHGPFKPQQGEGTKDMLLSGITLDRLSDRKTLLTSLDRFRRQTDASGMMEGLDSFNRMAFDVLTSGRLVEALDIEREDPRLRAKYGKGIAKNKADGGPRLMEHFLIARRLVEAGVRCVTLAFSRWDWHGSNFKQGRQDMPMLDQGVAALIEDLYARGLEKDVTVVVWGEFGRTPRINKGAGRDHWPPVACALLAGGGMRTGQAIGSTNRLGEVPKERPVHFQNVFATLYHNLGIDLETKIRDHSGRPRYLTDIREPVHELI